jgi:C4-dicarboxylate-specific signal transduction histidine kinase
VRSALVATGSTRFITVVSDSAVKQMIFNVLDNALEAAPAHNPPGHQQRAAGELVLRCTDNGPGLHRHAGAAE